MKDFLEICDLVHEEINHLIKRAIFFKNSSEYPNYSQNTVANLFYENSTRTRVSFELAAKRLSMTVVNFDLHHSSESKGELMEDTIKTLAAMGIRFFVIRHTEDGLPMRLASELSKDLHFINAGDGKHAHPSQAMLDIMTIVEQKPHLEQLKIAIVGDIRHSRVANSLQYVCAAMNIKQLTLIAPSVWQPEVVHFGEVTSSLKEGLTDADVIICLRVQKERLLAEEHLNLDDYHQNYALTTTSLAYAKPDAMIMHPGPINRGVEIDSEVADSPQSYILQQVENGVFMRMAILESLISGKNVPNASLSEPSLLS